MASTIDDFMTPCKDELHLKAIKNQILSNLRILEPGIVNPTITSAFVNGNFCWRAAIWDDQNNIVFATTEGSETVVDAMRVLLRLTSTFVDQKMDLWEAKSLRHSFKTSGGVMYI